MIVTLDTRRLTRIADMQAFLDGSDAIQFQSPGPAGRRQWLTDLLRRFRYPILGRADKGILRRFAMKVGGFARARLTRPVAQWLDTGLLLDRRGPPTRPFQRRYTPADVTAPVELDRLHEQLSGPATRKLAERACCGLGDPRYQCPATISGGHLYDLRASAGYRKQRGHHRWRRALGQAQRQPAERQLQRRHPDRRRWHHPHKGCRHRQTPTRLPPQAPPRPAEAHREGEIGANTDTDRKFSCATYTHLLEAVAATPDKTKTETCEDRARREAIVSAWYRAQIRMAVPELLARWQPPVRRKANAICILRMKTRLGGCNIATRNLRLNTEPARKPPECLDYVLLYELVHLREPTRDARFSALMDRLMPRWRDRRALLNRLPLPHASTDRCGA